MNKPKIEPNVADSKCLPALMYWPFLRHLTEAPSPVMTSDDSGVSSSFFEYTAEVAKISPETETMKV